MAKTYTYKELGLDPVKQFMFPPCECALMVVPNEHYKEQFISILLSTKDRLNAAILLQGLNGEHEIIGKVDLSDERWHGIEDKTISQEVPVVIFNLSKIAEDEREKTIKDTLEIFDFNAVLIEEEKDTWSISHVEPFSDVTIDFDEKEYDYFAQCAHYTTEMPKIKPVKAEEWRQNFTYNETEFVLIASRTPDKMTSYELQLEGYGIGRSYIYGLPDQSKEDILERMEWLLYELFRTNPRTSELSHHINDLLKQVDLNGTDYDIIENFTEYGVDEDKEI